MRNIAWKRKLFTKYKNKVNGSKMYYELIENALLKQFIGLLDK